MKIVRTIALVIVAGLTVHCSSDKDGTSGPTRRDTYVADMGTLAQMSSAGPMQADAITNNAFSKLFGGTTGKDVETFINTRVKHVFNQEDLKNLRLQPAELGDIMGWQETPEKAAPGSPQVAAQNDGTAVYIMSRVVGVPVKVINGSQVIDVDSTRVGIVTLGEGYKTVEQIDIEDGTGKVQKHDIPLPPEYRLSTLIHEARHSDCTGGLPEAQVQIMKTATGMEDFLNKAGVEQMECGHAHVTCPAGHDFEGYAACDMETWGSYGVGAVYSLAAERNLPDDSIEKALMEIKHMDELSRLLKGKGTANSTFGFSSPNMSHSNF